MPSVESLELLAGCLPGEEHKQVIYDCSQQREDFDLLVFQALCWRIITREPFLKKSEEIACQGAEFERGILHQGPGSRDLRHVLLCTVFMKRNFVVAYLLPCRRDRLDQAAECSAENMDSHRIASLRRV